MYNSAELFVENNVCHLKFYTTSTMASTGTVTYKDDDDNTHSFPITFDGGRTSFVIPAEKLSVKPDSEGLKNYELDFSTYGSDDNSQSKALAIDAPLDVRFENNNIFAVLPVCDWDSVFFEVRLLDGTSLVPRQGLVKFWTFDSIFLEDNTIKIKFLIYQNTQFEQFTIEGQEGTYYKYLSQIKNFYLRVSNMKNIVNNNILSLLVPSNETMNKARGRVINL